MSGDRAQKGAEARRAMAEKEGMRQCLESPDGRALMSWITSTALNAEGPGSKQLRMLGRDILRAAQIANWPGLQLMREEYEKPRIGPRADSERGEEEGGE